MSAARHLAALAVAVVLLMSCYRRSAFTPVRVLAGDVDGLSLLAPVATRAADAGAGPLAPVGAAVVGQGDQLGSFVEVLEDGCLLVIAQPSESVVDVDLFAFSDSGRRLAADETPRAQGALMVCPEKPGRLYVAARVVAGNGMLALGVMPVPRSASPRVAHVLQTRGGPQQDSGRLDAWPGLETKIRERRKWLGGRWRDLRRVAMPVHPEASAVLSVTLRAGRCLDVLAIPGEGIPAIELLAKDEAGRVVARSRPPGRDREVVLCSDKRQVVSLLVRPRMASGLVAMVAAESAVGAVAELLERHPVVLTSAPAMKLEEAVKQHNERGQGLPIGPPMSGGRVSLRPGRLSAVPLTLPGGCSRLDVVAGTPLGGFIAELWSEGGRQWGRASGGDLATLFRCGLTVNAKLELSTDERPGPVAIELRHDEDPPPVLLKAPLAAARLLDWLDRRRGLVVPADAKGSRLLAVADEARKVVPVTVAPKHCVELIAALDGAARGVELRLYHSSAGDYGRSRGERVASQRMCAGKKRRQSRLELRVDAGPANVLLMQRMHKVTDF